MRYFIQQVCLGGLVAAALGAPLAAQDGTRGGVAVRAAGAPPQPGDRIHLHFLREPDLTDDVTVTERGEAVFPKLGSIKVSEIAIGNLNDTLRARYAQFLKEPEIEVLVLRRIVVTGEVKNPNVYFVDLATGLRDVIAMAGGVITSGNRDNVAIVRAGARRVVRGWDANTNSETDLLSGDLIRVGRRSWLSLNFLPAVSTAAVMAGVAISVLR